MKLTNWIYSILVILLQTGCQTTSVTIIDPTPLFHDNLFPGYQDFYIETAEDVFFINQSMKNFVDEKVNRNKDSDIQINALANAIFDHSDFNLLYKNDANTVAEETFSNHAANCLSLTIMTFALADYANFAVNFQQVDTPELWVRREGNNLLNRHVNLRLYKKTKSNVILLNKESYLLDFDRRAQSMHLPAKKIDKKRVLAMFYNNKAADALIKEKYSQAYAYFRSAITVDPLFIEAWSNFGTLYRRTGHIKLAEESYLIALSINKTDSTTLENMAYIYTVTGREDKAANIRKEILARRINNPFYYFMLGETSYDKQDWKQAVKHYKKAIRLNKKQHNFYFALARVYFKSGNVKKSKKYMALAKRYSHMEDLQLLYQGKLDWLENI
ncbi:MAG: tetratricopeptide repeat protein [Gammaproteobacteria bacterium]|nr:tetratricopeptide repeat protein [Gammaproteobacteria bacterium]